MIFDGASKPLSYDNIGIPNVADVVQGWLKPLVAQFVKKSIVDGDVVEEMTPIGFNGMIQPLSGYELSILPEGERDWEWVKIFTDYADFNNDDRFFLVDKWYRIMKKRPFERYAYGYYRYDAILDYEDKVVNDEEY